MFSPLCYTSVLAAYVSSGIVVAVAISVLAMAIALVVYKLSTKGNVSYDISNDKESVAEWKKRNWEEQQVLVERYATGELLPIALNYICKGDYTQFIPEQILVHYYGVVGVHDDVSIEFNFVKNRIENLESVCFEYSPNDSANDYVRPQVAMAEAINRLMVGAYEIYDCASVFRNSSPFGGENISYIYSALYVQMICKQTKPNRSF